MLTIDEKNTLIEEIGVLATKYFDENIKNMSSPSFEDDIEGSIMSILEVQMQNIITDDMRIEIMDLIYYTLNTITYKHYVPKRSLFNRDSCKKTPKMISKLDNKIKVLESIPQAEQRTEEWYMARHQRITASNAYKCMGSESMQNHIIYEKCKPVEIPDAAKEKDAPYVNTNTPCHHGQRYEPISVQYYEFMYKTTVGEFGCIPHNKYSFIGASPDGINIDSKSPLFGRMLEIKNIKNRDITGIPKLEYWVQMQMQMETCELNECDFLETRFIEYESIDDFKQDGTFQFTTKGEYKGIIKHFINGNKPHYEYSPFNATEQEYKQWESDIIKKNDNKTWLEDIYWRLDEISCVLVLRNRRWFENIVGQMQKIWDTILFERVNGYEHRAPRKRAKTITPEVKRNDQQECTIIIE